MIMCGPGFKIGKATAHELVRCILIVSHCVSFLVLPLHLDSLLYIVYSPAMLSCQWLIAEMFDVALIGLNGLRYSL